MNAPPTAVGAEAASALAALHAEAFDRPWDADAFAGLLRAPGTLALWAEGDGFILVQAVVDEAEVLTLAVRPAARRRGLGRTLLEAAAARLAALGVRTLRLEVAQDNPAALALYEAASFRRAGRRLGYYARPDAPAVDAEVLARTLNTPPV